MSGSIFMKKKAVLVFCCAIVSLFATFTLITNAYNGTNLHLDNTSLNFAYYKYQGFISKIASYGPGSYPPKCAGKCGDCSPCNPVHVTVPPGEPVTSEYYPEAWRCKCSNKLFLP